MNVAYGYAVIRLAARAAQALPQWRAHPRVAGLSLSDKWVCGWLRRAGLRRRRVTSVEKVPPPAAAVDARMREIQARIVVGGFAPCNVRSADETGVWYGAAPKNQYVGAGVRRGSAPPCDDRARFTAHLNGAADGTMHAPFFIVRCAATGPDLSGTRVLQGLRDAGGFGAAAGSRAALARPRGGPCASGGACSRRGTARASPSPRSACARTSRTAPRRAQRRRVGVHARDVHVGGRAARAAAGRPMLLVPCASPHAPCPMLLVADTRGAHGHQRRRP